MIENRWRAVKHLAVVYCWTSTTSALRTSNTVSTGRAHSLSEGARNAVHTAYDGRTRRGDHVGRATRSDLGGGGRATPSVGVPGAPTGAPRGGGPRGGRRAGVSAQYPAPNQLSEGVQTAVREVATDHPAWGAPAKWEQLESHAMAPLPSGHTVQRWLQAARGAGRSASCANDHEAESH
jgi:hypothetical protein